MSQRQALQNIVSSTQRFLSTFPLPCARSNLHEQKPRSSPSPLSLSESLDRFRNTLSESALLPQVSEVVISKATNLASFYERSYQQACQRILSLPNAATSQDSTIHQLAHTYRNLYENNVLPRFLADACRTQLTHKTRPSSDAKLSCPIRRRFNYEYVPFLEKYFELNAYPTSMERLKLAQQTKMTPRQIEVWFQNHRNRSKQFGKPLHRRSPDSCCSQMQHLFEQSLSPETDFESVDEQSCADEEETDLKPDAVNCLIMSTGPPHAYPTKYPPRDVSDPFPTKDGRFHFPPPVWRRSQNPNRPTCHVDIEELTVQFASKLHLRDAPSRKRRTPTRRARSWLPPTISRPYPAPLPALVRKSLHGKSSILPSTLFQSTTIGPAPELAKIKPALPKRLPTWRLSTNDASARISTYSLCSEESVSHDRNSLNLSSMPVTPPMSPTSDVPQVLDDFFDFDSPNFLADLMTTKRPPLVHSYSQSASPLSYRFNFGFPEF